MSDDVRHDFDPEAEAMRKLAFQVAVTFVDLTRDELQREIRRSRWWTRVLMVCVGVNAGAALFSLLAT